MVATSADSSETSLVGPALKKLKVNVVQTAVNSVPDTDTTAQIAEYQTIAQKFQSSGVNVVVAVGNAGNGWPAALQDDQSTYTPRIIATDYNDLDAYVSNKAGVTQSIIKNVLTAGPTPPATVEWNDPAMKSCVATIKKAEPGASISNPVTATASTPVTYTAPVTACQQVALFEDLVKAAGQDAEQPVLGQGCPDADPRHHSRRRRHVQLLRWPQRRKRTGVRLHVESVDQQAGAQDQRGIGSARRPRAQGAGSCRPASRSR